MTVGAGGEAGAATPGRSVAKSPLRRLATEVGIIDWYLDQTGRERRLTTDETRLAILSAMGIDASTPQRAEAALRALRAQRRNALLQPVRVVETSDQRLSEVQVRLPRLGGTLSWSLELHEEEGRVHRVQGKHERESVVVTFASAPPPGYHTLRLRVSGGRREITAEQSLIVVPTRCTAPDEILGARRAFGIVANLYAVHSERNWGIGDFTDLAELARWTGEVGGDFVGVNPLHALLGHGIHISPYSPVSRLFRNVAYLDVEAIPELHGDVPLDERIASPELRAELAMLREDSQVHYERVMSLKRPVLEALYRRFAERERDSESPRARAYRGFVQSQEPELGLFATWMALAEGTGGVMHGSDWKTWPAEYQDAKSDAVARFQREHADVVDFHRWLQFECDRQLATAAHAARQAGLAIGLYQDLAIGTAPSGSDTWSMPELFIGGSSIGAPPDPYSATGQNWGLPAIDPRALRENRYRYFVRLVRSGFRHAGALRIDHVMGLFRLFVIPSGLTGRDGAYIRYPAADLLGILALESARHRAVVVGEDLGTVPPEVPPALAKWGVLSSKVMYFERDRRGRFRRPSEYAPLSLATANTHDMPTLSGFWRGHDIELRAQVGLLDGGQALRQAREERGRDRESLLERLREHDALPDESGSLGADGPDLAWEAALRGAVHRYLCASPAVLVGIALDDLVGEVEPVNLPGVGPETFPSWTRRMRMSLEEIRASRAVREALGCEERRRGVATSGDA